MTLGCAAPKSGDIPNFSVVESGVYRGGQPNSAGWKRLAAMGVTTVVKLNTESEGSDSTAEKLGMRVIRVPITTVQQIIGPVAPQLEEGLSNISSNTYIHCKFGMNRTGTLIMLYRLRVCNWTKDEAEKEADSLGWDTSFPALRLFWEEQK